MEWLLRIWCYISTVTKYQPCGLFGFPLMRWLIRWWPVRGDNDEARLPQKPLRFLSFSCWFSRPLPRLSALPSAHSRTCWCTNIYGKMTKAASVDFQIRDQKRGLIKHFADKTCEATMPVRRYSPTRCKTTCGFICNLERETIFDESNCHHVTTNLLSWGLISHRLQHKDYSSTGCLGTSGLGIYTNAF